MAGSGDGGAGDWLGRPGQACSTADLPRALVANASASTADAFVVTAPAPGASTKEAATAPAPGASTKEAATAPPSELDLIPPSMIITIKDKNLDSSYIDELMRGKGLDEPQIAQIRAYLRQYIDSFIKDRGIGFDDGAYALVTNMLIHLIEESSRDE